MTKKLLCFPAALILMMLMALPVAAAESANTVMSDNSITVNGSEISEDSSAAVYSGIATESHPNTDSAENTIITITKGGNYVFTGTLNNGQIRVAAPDSDEVTVTLNGVNITNTTAPAILVVSGADSQTTNTAGVVISLSEDSENIVNGSYVSAEDAHYEAYGSVEYDAAISSDISLAIEGGGKLNLTGDNEGIETKMHLTINGGEILINSADDAINANNDNISNITINNGYIYANASYGSEGDAIDSNGTITINGGTIIAIPNGSSQDSGLDSDNGITVNGGTVVGIGNMLDTWSNSSQQQFMQLAFSTQQKAGTVIAITDETGNVISAFKAPVAFSEYSVSTPELSDSTYHIYLNGTIKGTEKDGLYTEVSSYSDGTQQQHSTGGQQGDTQPGTGTAPPDEGTTQPGANEEPPKLPTNGEETITASGSVEFTLSDDNHVFYQVSNYNAGSEVKVTDFTDLNANAWYYQYVSYAVEKGWFNGTSATEFTPNGNMTRAMLVTVLYRMSGEKAEGTNNFTDVDESAYYRDAVVWAADNNILEGKGNNIFDPQSSVTREEMATFIYRYSQYMGKTLNYTDDLSSYSDAGEISSWALEAMKYAVGSGLIQGRTTTTIVPTGTATRSEVATILQRFDTME
ncbi:MAG: carbohydrate-binding domain-containing protein [Bacillota bacterium]|nr:carbohydrate-binding domain-containing protein [Bacillota bacterium]